GPGSRGFKSRHSPQQLLSTCAHVWPSGYSWVSDFHSSQDICQTLQPSVGWSAGPPLLTTLNRSPGLVWFISHLAAGVVMLMQPWLTLRTPCAATDQGAEWKKMPLHDNRVA